MVLLISVFLISTIVLAAADTPPTPPGYVDGPKIASDCAKTHKLPMKEAADIIMKYKIKNKTANVKCFLQCYLDKSKAMDKIRERLEKLKHKHNCDSIKNNDKCVESFEKFECFIKIEENVRGLKKG
ncbi:uncharacterized protein LOC108037410 [Drosophila rhopaloa]|uniref:Uncharacterized protein LOC108037410 n=1 Tax=Drosophila rhopaloa TaxID=1041015 RepID=A0A6P4DVN3_DRORH|nr:uncharacterized protein LOC108037410 [Drosophila rhopaloa]